ncbi:MAG: O-antigen ligase family protein [Verrucomicrobia bacterium]|nr:O-antigen ligase family protein [Verrucomicrobiota bacterium]
MTLRALLAYHACDRVSEALIYFMVVSSPWAFGTTQPWSIWAMNACGFALGILLISKFALRRERGGSPFMRPVQTHGSNTGCEKNKAVTIIAAGLALLTLLILGYCLTAALNARSTYDPWRMDFRYRSYIAWLPHSYDSRRTWQLFFNVLALASFFWSVRDWLLGKTAAEERTSRIQAGDCDLTPLLPERLRRLLWVVSINGALLGAEGICQRLSDTNKLLWFMPTHMNKSAESQFGPYAYRANAAQYFNLVWPVALGLWWVLRREARSQLRASVNRTRRRHHVLLPCVLVMAACPIMSASRGGALVAVVMILAAACILLFAWRRRHPSTRFALVLFFIAILGLGTYLGGDKLAERMRDFDTGLTSREHIYETAAGIARDYPLFGIGPGAFEPVFQLYRASEEEFWPAELHNDWLEIRITFGWLGSGFIMAALLLVLARWFLPTGIPIRWTFTSLLWLSLAGCLIHARFDFPFQIYSILMMFVLLCAILFTLSRRVTE